MKCTSRIERLIIRRAIKAIRAAPAVWLDDGPVIRGPTISNTEKFSISFPLKIEQPNTCKCSTVFFQIIAHPFFDILLQVVAQPVAHDRFSRGTPDILLSAASVRT